MEIGINDLDFYDDEYESIEGNDTPTQNTDDLDLNPIDDNESEQGNDYIENLEEGEAAPSDVITELLRARGIQDRTKIKYENENGEVEEVDWDSLDTPEQLEILSQLNSSPESDLDDSEILLINAIRNSRMAPSEYLNYIELRGASRYAQNLQNQLQTYSVDQYSNEELYVADLINRMGLSEEEAQESLEKAKSNEALFNKLILALRNEYKQIEDENTRYAEYMQQQEEAQRYNQFASSIRDQIQNFTEFNGYDLNMDADDMQELYEFITGFDEAGTSIFGKAVNDPATLVKMAWFALNGEQMLDDISEYIKQVASEKRLEGYNKGVADAKAGKVGDHQKKSTMTYKPSKLKSHLDHISIDDLD